MNIYEIRPGAFGGPMRMGDILGMMNALLFHRKINWHSYNEDSQYLVLPEALSDSEHVQKFFKYIKSIDSINDQLFTECSATQIFPWKNVNVWDFRDISGDIVKINLKGKRIKKKICIFPLIDAPYNTYRNWPIPILKQTIANFSGPSYDDYFRILCCTEETKRNLLNLHFDFSDWIWSTDFETNINHINECEIFVGGDTGTTHYASCLTDGPKRLHYLYSSRGLFHTRPLHSGRGHMKHYWVDMEGTSFDFAEQYMYGALL